ncbi:ATP-dependent DNA ligase [Mesorhizobium sp. L-8-3]|uniref:ATP-dependent DNA ligase n=1 Tax=Mesorhizobium sp. L-8-3 TaxID=2744522 RepID=UPI00406C951A
MLRRHIAAGGDRLVFCAFDLLSLDGKDLCRRPCEQRRALLSELLASVTAAAPAQDTRHPKGISGLDPGAVDESVAVGENPPVSPSPCEIVSRPS